MNSKYNEKAINFINNMKNIVIGLFFILFLILFSFVSLKTFNTLIYYSDTVYNNPIYYSCTTISIILIPLGLYFILNSMPASSTKPLLLNYIENYEYVKNYKTKEVYILKENFDEKNLKTYKTGFIFLFIGLILSYIGVLIFANSNMENNFLMDFSVIVLFSSVIYGSLLFFVFLVRANTVLYSHKNWKKEN